jgi:hypothetical protein
MYFILCIYDIHKGITSFWGEGGMIESVAQFNKFFVVLLYLLPFNLRGKRHCTHSIGGWVVLEAGLEAI